VNQIVGPEVEIRLAHDPANFAPGEELRGEVRVTARDIPPIATEVSVLWHTEGRGDEDFAVHHFERFEYDSGAAWDLAVHALRTQLPLSPLSYEGVVVKIRWCVRARVFTQRGRDLVLEQPFQLGQVPPARAVLGPAHRT
jgi:hypothetical protein